MGERTRTGLEILMAAGLMGLLGNVLLRQTPWGLNAFVFVAVFTGAMIVLAVRRRPELLSIRTLALQGAMVFFAAMFVLRDSDELHVFDTFAILIIMGVLVLANFGVNARVAGGISLCSRIFLVGHQFGVCALCFARGGYRVEIYARQPAEQEYFFGSSRPGDRTAACPGFRSIVHGGRRCV